MATNLKPIRPDYIAICTSASGRRTIRIKAPPPSPPHVTSAHFRSFFGNSEQSLCQDSAGLPPDIPPETVHSGDSSDGLLSGRWLGQGRASITEAEVDEEDTEEERGTQQQAGHPHSASLALVSSVLPLKRCGVKEKDCPPRRPCFAREYAARKVVTGIAAMRAVTCILVSRVFVLAGVALSARIENLLHCEDATKAQSASVLLSSSVEEIGIHTVIFRYLVDTTCIEPSSYSHEPLWPVQPYRYHRQHFCFSGHEP